jgi:hypothetical protein
MSASVNHLLNHKKTLASAYLLNHNKCTDKQEKNMSNTPRTAAFLREQIDLCTQYYLQVRPGSRAAAEVCRDMQSLRDELATALRSERHAPGRRISYLVAAMGSSKGALAQCFARSPTEAVNAVAALALDAFGEECECDCIDTEAAPGLWIEGDPTYIRAAIAGATGDAVGGKSGGAN